MDDAGNEATNSPADSVDGKQGRVKTWWATGQVDGEHGRVKTSFFKFQYMQGETTSDKS